MLIHVVSTLCLLGVIITPVNSKFYGNCRSYEYRCSNDRCIDDSVNCNGLNPCGDYSDCRLSAAAIAGIVIGSVFAICVLITLLIVCIRNKRGPPAVRTIKPIVNSSADYGATSGGYSSTSGYTPVVTPVSGYEIQVNSY